MSLRKFVPLLGGMSVGKHVRSSKFGPGGHDWQVRFYPDGVTED
jgi:speckle-type POZ protein